MYIKYKLEILVLYIAILFIYIIMCLLAWFECFINILRDTSLILVINFKLNYVFEKKNHMGTYGSIRIVGPIRIVEKKNIDFNRAFLLYPSNSLYLRI